MEPAVLFVGAWDGVFHIQLRGGKTGQGPVVFSREYPAVPLSECWQEVLDARQQAIGRSYEIVLERGFDAKQIESWGN